MISQVKLDELPQDRIIEIINEMSPRQMADQKRRNSELWHYIRMLLEPDKLALVEGIDSVLPQEATDFSLPQLDQQERTDTSPYCDEFAQNRNIQFRCDMYERHSFFIELKPNTVCKYFPGFCSMVSGRLVVVD